jgi:hypothetical protein
VCLCILALIIQHTKRIFCTHHYIAQCHRVYISRILYIPWALTLRNPELCHNFCVCLFCMIVTISSNYFLKRHLPNCLCNWHDMCSLWGRIWGCINNFDEHQSFSDLARLTTGWLYRKEMELCLPCYLLKAWMNYWYPIILLKVGQSIFQRLYVPRVHCNLTTTKSIFKSRWITMTSWFFAPCVTQNVGITGI